jgi:cysteine desulfurase
VRFSFDSTVTADELRQAAAAVHTAVGGIRALGTPSTR